MGSNVTLRLDEYNELFRKTVLYDIVKDEHDKMKEFIFSPENKYKFASEYYNPREEVKGE